MKKRMLVIASLCALSLVGVASSLAFLVDYSNLFNHFMKPASDIEIVEQFDKYEKASIRVKNTGDVPMYIRVRLSAGWFNSQQAMVRPASLNVAHKPSWIYSSQEDTYTYQRIVQPGAYTDELLDRSIRVPGAEQEAGNIYKVDVLASSIQAIPTNAVVEAWGVTLGSDAVILGVR